MGRLRLLNVTQKTAEKRNTMGTTMDLNEVLAQIQGQKKAKGQTVMQGQLLEDVLKAVQGVLEAQGQKTPKKREVREVVVDQPFYMKNGGEAMGMITQGAARNVPVELKIIKRVGNKAITVEKYRARFPQYISLRAIKQVGGKEYLALREVDNQVFTTVEEAKKIVTDLLKELNKS